MGDPLDKYRKRYKELKEQEKVVTTTPKTAIKTETVNNTDVPEGEYQADYPTLKYNEYNTPNLDWLSQDVKDRVMQTPVIENPQEHTKTGTQKSSRGDVEQYKIDVATDEQQMSAKVQPLIEKQRIKEGLVPKETTDFVLPDKFQLNEKYKEFKAEDDQFIQGVQDMPVDEDTKGYINSEWKKYTIERDREQMGSRRYLDATLKGLGRSVYTGFGLLPEEYLPSSVKKQLKENYDNLSELEKHVSDVAQTVADVYIGLGLSGKVVSPLISKIPINSLVGQRIMHSTATLLAPQIFQEGIKGAHGDFNADETLQNIMTTSALGVTFGANPFKNLALKSLYDVIVPTTVQTSITQPALNPLDDSGQPMDWGQVGKDAFFNVLFGVVQGYREGTQNYRVNKKISEDKAWIIDNVKAIEEGRPVDPEFKDLLKTIETDPVVKETIQQKEEIVTKALNKKDRRSTTEVPVTENEFTPVDDAELRTLGFSPAQIKAMTPENRAYYATGGREGIENPDFLPDGKVKISYTLKTPETATETPIKTVSEQKPTTDLPVQETAVQTPKFEKVPISDVERNVKSTDDIDIQAGEEVFTYGGSKAKVVDVKDGLATVQTEQGKTIKIGVGALSRKPMDEATLQAEKDIRKMIDGTEDLELWEDVRVHSNEMEDNGVTHGSEIQFVSGVKKVLKSIVGERVMNFAELVATKPVARDFARDKGLKFTGRKLEGTPDTWADQIVDMYKVFRSGKVENTVLIGVGENGEVIGTMALTANHPMYTGYDFTHVAKLVESGAKHIVMGHNHPSGNPMPSGKDLKSHVAVNQFLRLTYPEIKMQGSYVLNHKKYAWISDVVNDQMNAQYEIRNMQKPLVDLTNRSMMNIGDQRYKDKLIDHAKKVSSPNNALIVLTDTTGEIRDFSVIPFEVDANGYPDASTMSKILDTVKKRAGDTGGGLYKILTQNKSLAQELTNSRTEGSLPIGADELYYLGKDGSVKQRIDLGIEGVKEESSVFFEDMPYNIESFRLDSGLDLADDNIFRRTLDKLSDDTIIGRMARGNKKITDTQAWNNIMIDVERYTTKYPVLRPLYQVIDKVLVRNMQYDYNYGRVDIWKKGKHFADKSITNKHGMEKEDQIEFLAGLQAWHETNRSLQELEYPLMSVEEFFERHVKTEQQTKVANDMLAVKEHGLKMMKTTDVYLLEYKQTTNPLLEEFHQKQRYLSDDGKAKLLEKAMKEMTDLLDANGMAHFIPLIIEESGLKRPIDILNALWKIPNVRGLMIQELVKEKYTEYERQWYFPTTRMNGEFFIKATNKYDKPHFSTYNKLSEVRKALNDLSEDGYTIHNFDNTKDLTEQVENFELKKLLYKEGYHPADISVPELHQLAVKSGIDINSPEVKKMMETINAMGFKRHLIQKQYVEGFKWTKEDVMNAMESYLWGVSVHKNRTIGRLLAEQEQAKALENGATEEQMKFMQDYLDQFDDHTKDRGQAIRRATSVWWLAGKVSYYAQQMLQPINTTLPYIMKSEFGGMKNTKHFVSGHGKDLLAYEWYRYHKLQDTVTPEVLTKMEKIFGKDGLEIMDTLKHEGVLSSNNINDILGVQTRIEHQYKGILGKSADKLLGIISTPSSIVEATPRTGSALTLLRIGRDMGLQGDNLKNFIATGISRVMGKSAPKMGVPNVVNRFGSTARIWLRYPFVFRQFSAMNTALYGHLMDGKSGIWKILNPAMMTKLGVGMITRGTRYAPFVGSMIGVASIGANIYQWLKNAVVGGGGDDDDIDVDQIVFNMENYLNDEFGDGVGTSLVRGALTAVSGVDVSKIFQESTVLPTETLEYERGVTETIGGAPVAFVSQMIQAVQHEDWKRVLPVAITNVIRAMPPEGVQMIVESDWIPMTFKKSLVQGNISTSGITLKGNTLALPEELKSTIGGVDAITFARWMKRLGFTTLEISRIYENAKYIQDRNASYLDNLDTIEAENESFEKKDQLKVNDIVRKTNQKIGSELNKNRNVYTFYSFGEYLDDISADLDKSSDPIVLAYSNKLKKPEYRKAIFKRGQIKPYKKLLEDERITKEEFIDKRTKINQIIEEIK